MDKIKSALLAELKKSNKERKLKLAIKYGYNTVEEYEAYLKGDVSVKEKAPLVKPTIHNVHIMDASSSMDGGKFTNAVSGINEEIKALKKNTDAVFTQTLVTFSYADNIKTEAWKVDIAKQRIYKPQCDGMTALYAAIGQTLERLIKEANGVDKVLVKIFTDGGENDSQGTKWAKASVVSGLIKKAEELGMTITFVGTEQDVKNIINALKIDDSNTLVHQNTAASIKKTFAVTTDSTMLYASRAAAGKDVSRGFYKRSGTL